MQKTTTTLVDPGILEIVGHIANLLGLGEHIQRCLPIDRVKAGRRHKRVSKLLAVFQKGLGDARTALRVVARLVKSPLSNAPPESIAFVIFSDELPVFRRGIEQLLRAIRSMTNAALELESTTAGIPTEAERYYKLSEAGSLLMKRLRAVLNGNSRETPTLIDEAEKYLVHCDGIIRERDQWIQG